MAEKDSEHPKAKKRKLPAWMQSKTNEGPKAKSREEKFNELIPLLQFSGKLFYSYHKNDCTFLCEELSDRLLSPDVLECAVGFDIEWPVTYQSGEPKTAVLQLCTPDYQCYVFHISAMGVFPKALKNLLLDHRLVKTGVGIESDFWKLGRDFDIAVEDIIRKSVVDSGKLANKITNSRELWSLDNLCKFLLNKRLCKEKAVRTSDWSHYPLTEQQKIYAATDAYASLLIYQDLKKRESQSSHQ